MVTLTRDKVLSMYPQLADDVPAIEADAVRAVAPRILQRHALGLFAIDDPNVTRAQLRAQHIEFHSWLVKELER